MLFSREKMSIFALLSLLTQVLIANATTSVVPTEYYYGHIASSVMLVCDHGRYLKLKPMNIFETTVNTNGRLCSG